MKVLPFLGGTCFVLSCMPLWSVDIALRPSYRLKYKKTNLLVLVVMLAISAKLVVIFPHASVNISLQTNPHTSSNTYKAQNLVLNLALRIVLKSLIPPLPNFNLNLRRLCI